MPCHIDLLANVCRIPFVEAVKDKGVRTRAVEMWALGDEGALAKGLQGDLASFRPSGRRNSLPGGIKSGLQVSNAAIDDDRTAETVVG